MKVKKLELLLSKLKELLDKKKESLKQTTVPQNGANG